MAEEMGYAEWLCSPSMMLGKERMLRHITQEIPGPIPGWKTICFSQGDVVMGGLFTGRFRTPIFISGDQRTYFRNLS